MKKIKQFIRNVIWLFNNDIRKAVNPTVNVSDIKMHGDRNFRRTL